METEEFAVEKLEVKKCGVWKNGGWRLKNLILEIWVGGWDATVISMINYEPI